MEKATQKDIARALGISLITVQRALNNSGYVSKELKKKIEDYIKKVDYTPHKAAQVLVRRKPRRIFVFSTDYPAFFWDDISQGVDIAGEQLAAYGFEVTHCRIPRGKTSIYLNQIERKLLQGADGIALVNNMEYDMARIVEKIENTGLPFITFNIDIPKSKRLCFIGPDYHAEGRLAAELIEKLVSRKLAVCVIHSNLNIQKALFGSDIFIQRLNGFLERLKETGNEKRVSVEYINYKAPLKTIESNILNYLGDQSNTIGGLYCIPPILAQTCHAVEELGMNRRIAFIGSDLSPEIRHYIENGTITAEIYQNPVLQGYYTIKILEKIIEENHLPQKDKLIVVHEVVLKENLGIYCNQNLFPSLDSLPHI